MNQKLDKLGYRLEDQPFHLEPIWRAILCAMQASLANPTNFVFEPSEFPLPGTAVLNGVKLKVINAMYAATPQMKMKVQQYNFS